MRSKTIFGEMLIILVVVGVLGMITFNQFSLASAKSRDADRMSSFHELSKAIRLYYKDYGRLPGESEINSLWGKEWKDGDYTYLKVMPSENYLDNQFCYQVSEDKRNFIFFANLENKYNVDCKKDAWECGGKKYCYRDTLPAEVIK